jgi:hypothetical protein
MVSLRAVVVLKALKALQHRTKRSCNQQGTNEREQMEKQVIWMTA